ncbi:NAD(P)/FAD-dependent oxidoreductase [Hoeflea prorocentri]|uniref:FAD-dependent oxidoreductase n=1 Tax=Hoeflea prorocentri TaxID=1922333 RepID=A0A9X3UIM0_9HYPH|nr:FAD-dependent oxidoreductase [Hoeflea prorocentri]MCY6381110.1 FAD-dependent oxidoreductase [Hoeflea prorocentri]MDA5398910.1 FAD-dependent oxidoreductase [Hoeflea prorocentri]
MSVKILESSLWQVTTAEKYTGSRLEGSLAADLVIIGGGFTGCAAALEASGRGLDVCLIEADRIAHGGSGRNVGLVNAGLWTPPEKVEKKLGREVGAKLNALLAAAPETVFSLVDKHDIQCEATRKGTLHCAHSRAGMSDLRRRFDQLIERGAPVRLLNPLDTAARTGTSRYHGALFDRRAGTIQPSAYCNGLARAANQAGARIFTETIVKNVGRKGDRWIAHTDGGSVSARAMLLATNAYHEAVDGVAQPAFVPVHYFQVATAPMKNASAAAILPGLEGCWDTAPVMSSFRRDAAGRLLVGAVGSLAGIGERIHRNWARAKVLQLFPHLADLPIEFAWHGRIAMTSDHLPKVMRLGPSAYSVFGYSGRGIAPGTLFGIRLAAAIATDNEDELPVPPSERHSETATALRAAYYESGARLAHFLRF